MKFVIENRFYEADNKYIVWLTSYIKDENGNDIIYFGKSLLGSYKEPSAAKKFVDDLKDGLLASIGIKNEVIVQETRERDPNSDYYWGEEE